MAYGNWGAFVYKNGERQPNREDATPYREGLESGYHQVFSRDKGYDPHHAVLGNGPFRLCGYKNYPVLFLDGKKEDIVFYRVDKEIDIDHWEFSESNGIKGEWKGYKFFAGGDDPLYLEVTEPDGTKWAGECGYMMGAGHEDTDC